MSGLRIVTVHCLQNPSSYITGILFIAASCVLATWIPRLLGQVTDSLRYGHAGEGDIAGFARMIVAVGAGRVIAGWAGRFLTHMKGRELTYTLRRELFAKWSTLSPSYYHTKSSGELISHALSDVDIVGDLVTLGLNMSVTGIATLIGTFWQMVVHVDWKLSVASVGPLLFIPVLVRRLGPAIRSQSHRAQEALDAMSQVTGEAVWGVRAVKAFGQEAVFNSRFEQRAEAIFEEKMRFARLSALFSSLVPLMVNIGFVFILGYGGFLVATKAISLGDFVAFTLYAVLLRLPLEQLSNVINIVQRAVPSLDRLATLLSVEPEIRNRPGALTGQVFHGDLLVDRLTFRYPGSDHDVLHDLSFSVRPGQTLGIIGAVGSGKSTLADLLIRLYDPPSGSIRIGGRDILDYSLATLRKGVACVPQEGFLFSGTVLENIGFSDEEPDEARAERCAVIAVVHESILQLPEGYDTEVGERGARLSGGQKQRLAIARMLYKDAPFQLLDDPLSAVDLTTERRILDNLRTLKASSGGGASSGKITIIISHRLSAVQHADEILVLQEGRIVERGSHETLLDSEGYYAFQWSLQNNLFSGDDGKEGNDDDKAYFPKDFPDNERQEPDALPAVFQVVCPEDLP
ncbi:MAG: ABC transporter ATP-binding protein [Chlorobiaceae bacterium]|nr:ABC transporter ATP-binding protein [Chlorobiaceae bacterium]